jgi:Uncharacterized conserved protein
MKLHHEFTVRAPIDDAFRALTDLAFVAPCMPGATLSGREGDRYLGTIRVKIGPISAEFSGAASFLSCDPLTHTASIEASGRDVRSGGAAQATVTARLRQVDGETLVEVDTDLGVTGRIAQFGRGAIGDISAKLLDQFAQNLNAALSSVESELADVSTNEPLRIGDLIDARRFRPWAALALVLLLGLALRSRALRRRT